MPELILDLRESIALYPDLARLLGPEWVDLEANLDPYSSLHPLALWLRNSGASFRLSKFNDAIRGTWDIRGMASRRRVIRDNPDGFREAYSEVMTADWISCAGFKIEGTKVGPDFNVTATGGSILPLEVTAPRQEAWRQDVFERVDLLARATDLSFHIDYERSIKPRDKVKAVSEIVGAAVKLVAAKSAPASFDPGIKLSSTGATIRISRDRDRPLKTTDSTSAARIYGSYFLASQAAKKKSQQLASDRPVALLVCIDQMEWEDVVDFHVSYHTHRDELGINWSIVPPAVKFLMLCTFEGVNVAAKFLVNPKSQLDVEPDVWDLIAYLFSQRHGT